jgi:hypothetical protein
VVAEQIHVPWSVRANEEMTCIASSTHRSIMITTLHLVLDMLLLCLKLGSWFTPVSNAVRK